MDYIKLIERVIGYIESNLEDEINLDAIASRENFSTYYFHRIFSALVGETLASYIRMRRLNASVCDILESTSSLTEIAMKYNFGSQSSFIRSFKEEYKTTPSMVRKGQIIIKTIEPPDIVKRSLMNFNSDLVTKFQLITTESIELYGTYVVFDLSLDNYKENIRKKTKAVLESFSHIPKKEAFRVFFDCENDKINLRSFIGFTADCSVEDIEISKHILPKMLVAEFHYEGDVLDIGDVIGKDLMRWAKIAKQDLHLMGMSAIQKIDLEDMEDVFKILIPIQEDKQAL